MEDELGRFGRGKSAKEIMASREALNTEAELVKCYKQVDRIYF